MAIGINYASQSKNNEFARGLFKYRNAQIEESVIGSNDTNLVCTLDLSSKAGLIHVEK